MKFRILLPALFLFFSVSHAQEIKIDAGLGLGTTFDNGVFGLHGDSQRSHGVAQSFDLGIVRGFFLPRMDTDEHSAF
ncbi:hypothetical protein Belba_0881 [Belliella baltica DSM 15883]|uniref:Outer membrane protein beta-barrel domain-containing protein n=1 Tax=Belliella baltica (strain DSM 15883 / CIP 108006 / LMG 21964 / BA134) TaxID=866536 RepID=I3Z2R0_BELBD|nr:hypothetical protein [Belliella baltica]AFL83528.1 hypothetical protein Belba_0881 [Belliella baltica DSM 15883]